MKGILFVVVLSLLLASCAPAAPAPAKPTTQVAPAAAPKQALTPGPQPPTPSPKPAIDQPRSGGVLAISAQTDPPGLDLHQVTSYLAQNVLQTAYNGVTQFSPSNPEEVIGDLASKWEVSSDGLTYTFRLHDNVKFHSGAPLTAEDARFSFERMMTPPRGVLAPRRADLAAISKVEAADGGTLIFRLKYPSSSFLQVISSGWMAVYSRAFVEQRGDMKKDVMGTGPYKFKQYTPGISLEYSRNPDYFVKGRPYLDGITFFILKDAGTRLAAFRTGQVKLTGPGASGLTASDAEIIKKTMPTIVLTSYPSLSRNEIVLQNQRKPWSDIRVRRAVHLATDRQNAIAVLEQGYGEIGSHMPGKWGIPKEELQKMPGFRQPKDADVAEAKKLLAEAGYPDGFRVKALLRAEKQIEELGVYVADQLAKIGIKLELDIKDTATRTDLLNQGAYDMAPQAASLAFPDPQNVARYWAAPAGDDWGQNWHRNTDEKIWELFDKQARALDPAERMKIVRELDLKLIESAASPQLFWRTSLLGSWPEVRDRGKVVGFFSFQKYQDVWLAK